MKIGFDIHGVIDRDILWAKGVMAHLISHGHEIHILTGTPWAEAKIELDQFGILQGEHYHKHFSIVDWNLSIQNPTMHLETNGWWMSSDSWNASKGIYAREVGLDVMFENEEGYKQYFPQSCEFVLVPGAMYKFIVEVTTSKVRG